MVVLQQREIQRIRSEMGSFPRHPLNIRRILVTLTVVIAAILLFFAYLMGGRLGKIVGLLICAIAVPPQARA